MPYHKYPPFKLDALTPPAPAAAGSPAPPSTNTPPSSSTDSASHLRPRHDLPEPLTLFHRRTAAFPARGWRKPQFNGKGGELSPYLVRLMREVLADDRQYAYLDPLGAPPSCRGP